MRRGSLKYKDPLFDGSAAPPTPQGAGEQSAEPDAISGGAGGFTHRSSAWDVVAGQAASMSDLRDFLEEVDEQPALRAAATLRAMGRLRDALDQVPEMANMGDPVVLRLQDVALIARQLLARLR